MTADRKVVDAIYRTHFGAFVYAAFKALNPGQRLMPNWHIDAIGFLMQQMVDGDARRRLVLNLPPRSLKSFIVSVALPAWLLGRKPSRRIICCSYSDQLAAKFSRDCRALIESPFYKRVFPKTRLNPKKTSEAEFETTARGYRLATSVHGTLTGRGGDTLLVDDPSKAGDSSSEVALQNTIDWFRNTALSRLDNPGESLIVVVMQRLHVDDLSGILVEQDWPKLVIPAIATEPADYLTGEDQVYHRPAGQLLQPARDSQEAFDELKAQLGSQVFAAQFQQNPTPPDGNMIKRAWLQRYDTALDRGKFDRVILTCDPAGKAGPKNDYTAITVLGVSEKAIDVLHVCRGHWTVIQMQERILGLVPEWNVDLVVVEDTSSGMGLLQLLRERKQIDVVGRRHEDDKETRLLRQQGRFEAGRIRLPSESEWLAEFENELLSFPYGRYDDQVDALLLGLEWYADNAHYLQRVPIVAPVLLTRDDPWPWPRDPWPLDWSYSRGW